MSEIRDQSVPTENNDLTTLVKTTVPQYELKSYNKLRVLKKAKTRDGSREVIVAGYACLDETTQAFTKDGWKYYHQLLAGEEVACLNGDTFEWQAIEKVHIYDYSGELHQLKTNRANFAVTPNHRVHYAPRKGKPFALRDAESLPKSSGLLFSKALWKGEIKTTFTIPEHSYNPGGGYRGSKGYIATRPSITFQMEDWVEFLGYYISEGHLMAKGVGISQSKEKNPEVYEKIRHCITRLGFPIHEWGHGFVILSAQLRELLKPLGKSHEKHIPKEYKNLPSHQLRILFTALIAGDGTTRYVDKRPRAKDGGFTYYTCSERLADDVVEISLKLGYSTSYRFRGARGENRKPSIEIGISSSQRGWNKKQWSKIQYTGKVWCLTVPSGIFLIRRNNKVCWTGNSPQVIDKERHLITKEALKRDLPRFLAHPKYRNANLLHSNIQIGEVLPKWRDPKTGKTYLTKVDDIGLFAVVRIRTDRFAPPIVKKVIEDIESGKLASFSISADAPFESRHYTCTAGNCFWVIDEIVFYEITICEKPINPDARFTILSKAEISIIDEYLQSSDCANGSCSISKGIYGNPVQIPVEEDSQLAYEPYSKGFPPEQFIAGMEIEKKRLGNPSNLSHVAQVVQNRLRSNPRYYDQFQLSDTAVPVTSDMMQKDDIEVKVKPKINVTLEKDGEADPREFRRGMREEADEHLDSVGGDESIIRNLVLYHLKKDPHYYTKLASREHNLCLSGYGAINKPNTESDEEYYLNLDQDETLQKDNEATGKPGQRTAYFITGQDNPTTPHTQERIKMPRLQPPVSGLPVILKDVDSALRRAIREIDGHGEVTPTVQAMITSAFGKGFVLEWTGNDWEVDGVSTVASIESIRKSAEDAGLGKLVNELGLLAERVSKANPITDEAALATAERALILSANFRAPITVSSILQKGLAHLDLSDPHAALHLARETLDRVLMDPHRRNSLNPQVLVAMDSLYDDVNAAIDGLEMTDATTPTHGAEDEVMNDTGISDKIREDVDKANALLNQSRKNDLQRETLDRVSNPTDSSGFGTNPNTKTITLVGQATSEMNKAEAHRNGAMIAWYPTSGVASQLAQTDGEPGDELHVTLVYFGDHTEISDADKLKIERIVKEVSLLQPSLQGEISGMARFNVSTDQDGEPIVALLDVPGLSAFRSLLCSRLRDAGVAWKENHDFTPHMTLRYDPPGMNDLNERGIPRIESTPISIDKVWIVYGDEKQKFSLDDGVAQVSGMSPATYYHKLKAPPEEKRRTIGEKNSQEELLASVLEEEK